MLIPRLYYWNRIRPFVGKPIIKVITGMRRVGKSYFLRQIKQELIQQGVTPSAMMTLDMEDLDNAHIDSAEALHSAVIARLPTDGEMLYLFVDEVQEIPGWEKAIASLAKRETVDVYISGSNAHLLSQELATLLSGRYLEFPLYPLGFSEYLSFRGEAAGSRDEELQRYLRFGGMPALFHFEDETEIAYHYDSAVLDTILLKDVVARFNIRNASLLMKVTAFVFDNIGQMLSARSIVRFCKSQGIRTSVDTVLGYLDQLCSTFAVHRALRYDLKGKRHLEMNEKYFVNDLGMRHALLGFRNADISQLIENLVYLELRRRDYKVAIGTMDDYEVDFVATRSSETRYVQVAYLVQDKETLARELRPLTRIPDNYPKQLISLDPLTLDDYDGIQHLNLIDFLLSPWE